MCEVVPRSLTIEHKTDRKAISSQLSARFEAEGETFHAGLLQQMKPGSIILNRRQKGAGQGMVPTGLTRSCFSLALRL
jgi:hypothetical protein